MLRTSMLLAVLVTMACDSAAEPSNSAATPSPVASEPPTPLQDDPAAEAAAERQVPPETAPETPTEDVDLRLHADQSPVLVVWLHEHELLRSETRTRKGFLEALASAGVKAELVEAFPEDRAAQLHAWLDAADPAARDAMDLSRPLSGAEALVVVRLAPQERRIARGVTGVGVLSSAAPHERLWVSSESIGAGLGSIGKELPSLVADASGGVQ